MDVLSPRSLRYWTVASLISNMVLIVTGALVRVTGSGHVKAGCAGKRHGMRKRPQKMKREARQGLLMFKADAEKVIKHFLRP